ncbi:MAG TPA: ABC transporter permease [Candidatus Binatia bacterium]|nr:ABC transporter permease [Candidatus Binatia bacterium]
MGAVATLWRREVTRFVRQRSRVVGALLQPVVFWVLLGGGLSASFRPPGAPSGTSYLAYLYPGILALVLLFTAIFATISTVEDRRTGFLQGVLVAPVGRTAIVVGQALGGTTLAVGQGLLFLALAPLAGLALAPARLVAATGVMVVVAFGLTSLGLLIAWRMESTQGFHAIMNLILIPIWLLSGAFFPAAGVARPLAWAMALDPLTYGLAALRVCLDPAAAGLPPFGVSLAVAVVFAAAACTAAVATARRSGA